MMADGTLKLTDFGLAKENIFTDTHMTRVGTKMYAAPEVETRRVYTKQADLFSLGTVMY